ncbi:hypothetical protein INT47_002477 [Mucor saturninus]|uniref:Ndc10 domain-containing protein n=1 Tax=Mucor saturninus TaxID=64648 RepID=A0A8H7RHD3_9FUNG|nr:hypothetical protein INT47_002477 [Mucor saturninus]
MSTKNTNSKRPLVRTPGEEKYDQKNKETASEIHDTVINTSVKEEPKKARRGRPSKSDMLNRSVVATSFDRSSFGGSSAISSGFGSSSATVTQGHLIISQNNEHFDVTDFELAIKALLMKVRASTAATYIMPLEHWKEFCKNNRYRYPVDPKYPYTVGPTDFVVAFFKEFVFKRTYKKGVSIDTDVRTQIGLHTENADSQLTLLQMAEKAPSNKKGDIGYYKHIPLFVIHINPVNSLEILKNLWISSSDTGLREMFSISSRHHMLLRDRDLRTLNFADCFCTIIPKNQHKGMQQALALVFSLDKGKTLKEGEVKFACAMRHENIFRCPFGAFSFLIKKDNGNFLNEERWHNWKVLRGRAGPEKSLSGVSQWKRAKKALANEDIHTTRVTHGGRHAGSVEAEGLGVPFDLIKRGGGWKDHLGRLESHYLGKVPSPFARGMAGFWEKSFSLARNSVSPPIDLQKKIFPWIESYFGCGNLEWEVACEKEMKEVDENEDEDDNTFNLEITNETDPVEFVEEDGKMVLKEKKIKRKRKAESPEQY